MDIASLIGLLGAIAMIAGAMLSGGGIGPFIDVPSVLIVFGGTFFAAMYTAPLPTYLGSFGAMAKAFLPPVKKMDVLVTRMVELAAVARKDGMMALDGQSVPDKFFEKGLQGQTGLYQGLDRPCACYGHDRHLGGSGADAWQYGGSEVYWSCDGCGAFDHALRRVSGQCFVRTHADQA